MLKSTFFERFNLALELRQVTPAELSRKTGIDEAAISNYRNGKYKAKQDKLYLISQALRVSPAWLMGYDVPMTEHMETNTIPTNKQELIDKIVAMPDDQFQRFQMLLQTFEEISKND